MLVLISTYWGESQRLRHAGSVLILETPVTRPLSTLPSMRTCGVALRPANLSETVPELPDIVVYIEALEQRIQGHTLERVHLASPFLLRTAEPPIASVEGKRVLQLRRIGKRIGFGLEGDLWLVLHLMIAGRLHWTEVDSKSPKPPKNPQEPQETGPG